MGHEKVPINPWFFPHIPLQMWHLAGHSWPMNIFVSFKSFHVSLEIFIENSYLSFYFICQFSRFIRKYDMTFIFLMCKYSKLDIEIDPPPHTQKEKKNQKLTIQLKTTLYNFTLYLWKKISFVICSRDFQKLTWCGGENMGMYLGKLYPYRNIWWCFHSYPPSSQYQIFCEYLSYCIDVQLSCKRCIQVLVNLFTVLELWERYLFSL